MRAKRKNVCQPCRSRKLACDGKQPACSQCVRRKIGICDYHRDFKFINCASSGTLKSECMTYGDEVTPLKKERTPKAVPEGETWYITSPGIPSPRCLSGHFEPNDEYGLENNISFIVQSYQQAYSRTPLELNPHQNQICGAWVEILPTIPVNARRPFLKSAIRTLATTIRSHSVKQEFCKFPIPQYYFGALTRLGKAIEEAKGDFRVEHCIAIMCLAVTDILTPRFGSSWATHARAVGDLMKSFRPETFRSGVFHTIFVGFRPLLLINSIQTKRATFLAEEEWTTIPFRGRPLPAMQLLINRASILPCLLERYYSAKDLLANLAQIHEVRQDFQNFLQSLQEWELTTQTRTSSPPAGTSPVAGEALPAIAEALWFPDIMTANSLTHYWAFRIIAKNHLSKLDAALYALETQPRTIEPASITGESDTEESAADLAEMICNSMEYLTQPNVGMHHAGSAFFTLPTALAVFQKKPKRYSRQLAHGKQISRRLASLGIHFIHEEVDGG